MQVIEPHEYTSLTTGRQYALLYHRRRLTNALALGAGDALALALALLLAGWTRAEVMDGAMLIPAWSPLLLGAWWAGAAVSRLLPGWGLGVVEELRRTMTLLALLGLGTAFLLFATKTADVYSRLTVSLVFVYGVPLLPYGRALVKQALIRLGRWGVPTAIYGAGPTGARLVDALRQEQGLGYVPVAVFDDDPDSWGDTLHGVPILGDTTQSTDVAPVALIALADLDRPLHDLLDGPLAPYKQTVIIPDLAEMPTLWVQSRDIAGNVGLEITSNLLDPLARITKRALDLALVVGSLPIWLPLCLLIGLAIRLADGHAALFRQRRMGRNGEAFTTLKFQTMRPDADLDALLADDPALLAEWTDGFKLRRDPRVTPLGRFLRRTSLDELPQLVNVLRGEMSLVGPRPLPAYHLEELSSRVQHLRSRLRPGLTGLWQVSGRSDTGNDGFERWDAYYVRNWSVWLDLVILTRTVRALLRRDGAY